MKLKSNIVVSAAFTLVWATMSLADAPSFDFKKLKGRDNLQQTPLGSSGQWSLEKILALRPEEVLELWRSLPAVPMKEMNGHYMGLRPDTGAKGPFANGKLFSKESYWLGKAFRPLTE